MKSSSQLFPVELVSAEHRGQYFEDLYSLKPNKCEDKTVEIALLHLHAAKQANNAKCLLLVHDAFQCHWQWMDNGANQGVIGQLVANGWSIWLMDWRAHGSSKKNRIPQHNHLCDMAANDLTSVVEFIEEQGATELSVIAKGYGAQMAMQALDQTPKVKQFYFMDAQSFLPSRGYYWPFVRTLRAVRLLGKSVVSGAGTEVEHVQFFKRQLRHVGWLSFLSRTQRKTWQQVLLQHHAKVNWLCSTRGFARKAKRLLGKQAKIQRVSTAADLAPVQQLVAS